jgi:hypothetical protein
LSAHHAAAAVNTARANNPRAGVTGRDRPPCCDDPDDSYCAPRQPRQSPPLPQPAGAVAGLSTTQAPGPSSSQLDIISEQDVKNGAGLINIAFDEAGWIGGMNPVGRDWLKSNLQAILKIPREKMIDMAQKGVHLDPEKLSFVGKQLID